MLLLLMVLASNFSLHQGGDGWILLRGDSDNATISGSGFAAEKDLPEARKRLRDSPAGCLWIRRGGRRYLATDPDTLKAMFDAQKPQEALGQKQAALGERQAALGEQQAELGGRQGELGARQALDPADPSLSREQVRLSREQAELGRKQAVLGQEQAVLGRQQAELSKQIERTVGRLIDGLIQSGKARELKD